MQMREELSRGIVSSASNAWFEYKEFMLKRSARSWKVPCQATLFISLFLIYISGKLDSHIQKTLTKFITIVENWLLVLN
jgi:hypothetical protein